MASSWLRLYTETLNDLKVQQLPGDLFKTWINLLCIAKEYNMAGQLPSIDDIAFKLRVTRDVTRDNISELCKVGLVDEEGQEEGFFIHGWEKRQFVSDTDPTAIERKRRQRKKIGDVTDVSRVTSRTSHGPSHGDVTRTDSEQSQNRTESLAREESADGRKQNPGRSELTAYIAAWNSAGLPEYRRIFESIPNIGEVREALAWYTHEEVLASIAAYALILGDEERYEVRYPYQTAVNFLIKGVEKFAPSANPKEAFKRKVATNGHAVDDVEELLRKAREIQAQEARS